jgi:hypothetical protein
MDHLTMGHKYLLKILKNNKMFCKIYTTLNEFWEVAKIISECMNLSVTNERYIENEGFFSIYIDDNEEYDQVAQEKFPDGFLHFKNLVEIDFVDNASIDEIVNATNLILSSLWEKNYPAVAACEYEEKIVFHGGYKSTNVPWFNY